MPDFVEKYYPYQNYQVLNNDNKISSLPIWRYLLQSLKWKWHLLIQS